MFCYTVAMNRFSLKAACAVAILTSAAHGVFVPITNAWTGVNLHPEYKGATGTLTRVENGWNIHYDFTGGGHGMGMSVAPKSPIWARSIAFDARHGNGHAICLLMTDSAGQTFRKVARPAPNAWHRFVCDTRTGWGLHWGGPGDGEIRFPVRSFEINIDRFAKGSPGPTEIGDVQVKNIAYEEFSPEERVQNARYAGSPGVRYTITDFTPGDRFSAGPRAFYRGDFAGNDGHALADGTLEVDFARDARLSIYNEIPVWGRPEEFLLTVEAPAEAAGAEFRLGVRMGKPLVFNSFGKLRKPVPGRSRIYQTLSMPGPGNALGWGTPKKGDPGLALSKRVMRIEVARGDAPARKFAFRLVRLEAVVPAWFGSVQAAPLLATPPTDATPPRQLTVGYLNLKPETRCGGEIRVRLRDWEGRDLGEGHAPVPTTPPGGRAQVRVDLPEVPPGLNFVSYDSAFFEGGRPVADIPPGNVCWTRPLPDAGSPEKHPELPWGMGVYIHRSEDLFAYASGYTSPTNAAALARMERRAALAQAAGVKWERAEIKPSQIAYAKGKYDFSYYDKLFEIADRHGISCCLLFSHYWPVGYKPYTQDCYDAYVETVRRTVAHYKGRIKFCEIWNEPNIGFWTGPKEDYVKLVNAAHRVIKEVDSEIRVIACSTAGVDLKFIDMCIAKGMAYDDISIHTYRAVPEERTFLADLAAVTNRAHGNPTWITEMGWPTGSDHGTVSEREQAGKYARAYMTAAGSGTIHSIYGYNFVDDGFNVLERENNFGILRRDLTPKPAYRALAKVCRTFGSGTPSLESVKLSGCEAWIFRMGGRSAVWATGTARLVVQTDSPAEVTNLMDEKIVGGQTLSSFTTGPLAPVFFDASVLSVSEDRSARQPFAPDDPITF